MRLAKLGYPSPPTAIKSGAVTLYVVAAVRSIGTLEQVPFAACWNAICTRLPADAVIPEIWGKRPFPLGIEETPCSSIVFNTAPVNENVTATFPKGRS